MSIWSRICRPRHSTGLWPGSSQRRPPRTRRSDAEPDGSHPGLSPHTVVAVIGQRERSDVGVPNQNLVDYRKELCGVIVKRKRDHKTSFQILLSSQFFFFFLSHYLVSATSEGLTRLDEIFMVVIAVGTCSDTVDSSVKQ